MQIRLSVVSLYLQWLLQNSDALKMALCDFKGQLTSHLHAHCLLTLSFNLLAAPTRSEVPLQGLMVFTDGSGLTGWTQTPVSEHQMLLLFQVPLKLQN